MAGNMKPNIPNLGGEAIYTLLKGCGNSVSQNGIGLFDGTCVNEWDSNRVFYWSGSSSYLDIEILSSKVNIYRSGTTSWSGNMGVLDILKHDGTDYTIKVTEQYTLPCSTSTTEKSWDKFINQLPSGKYRFKQKSGLRIDSEWYIEDALVKKILLKDKNTDSIFVKNSTTLIELNTNMIDKDVLNLNGSYNLPEIFTSYTNVILNGKDVNIDSGFCKEFTIPDEWEGVE